MLKKLAMLFVCSMWLSSYIGSELVVPKTLYAQAHPFPKLENAVKNTYGNWIVDPNSRTQIVDPRLASVLAETYTDQVSRTYVDQAGRRIMLSISYGDDQRRSKLHLPRGCYEGQGYPVVSERMRDLDMRGRSLRVHEMIARRGDSEQEYVTYWVVYGNQLASEAFGSRVELFSQQFKGVIPDGILFRVSSIGGTDEQFSANYDFLRSLFHDETSAFFRRLIPERA